MTLTEMKQAAKAALDKANALVTTAETAGRALTESEEQSYNESMKEFKALNTTIKAREEQNSIRALFPAGQPVVVEEGAAREERPAWQSVGYRRAFAGALRTGRITNGWAGDVTVGRDELGGFKFPAHPNRVHGAAYETNATDGSAIYPSIVDTSTVIPLAPPPMAVERLATVIPTTMDVKFPRQTAFGTAAGKAEGTGSGANLFTDASANDPTMQQFTLGASMVGHGEDASWELLQDVQIFQEFMTNDILLSIAILKENAYINGGGAGIPNIQGLLGNVGVGVSGEAADGSGNLLSVQATFDVIGTLNPLYLPGSSWLMQVATAVEIRKAQAQANLFYPVFVSQNGVDYLHGKPVEYSAYMPTIAAGATPVLFGDFKRGYLIGVRGGAGVNVKILDQPKAMEGLLTVLGYQRIGAAVRRSEAIQGITLHT